MSQRTDYCREHKYRIETGFTCTKCGYNRPSEEENRLEELRKAKETAYAEGVEANSNDHTWTQHLLETNPYRSQP